MKNEIMTSRHIIAQNSVQAISGLMKGFKLYELKELGIVINNAPSNFYNRLIREPQNTNKFIDSVKPLDIDRIKFKMVDYLKKIKNESSKINELIQDITGEDIKEYVDKNLTEARLNAGKFSSYENDNFDAADFFKKLFNRDGYFLMKEGRFSYLVLQEHERGFEAIYRLMLNIVPETDRYDVSLLKINPTISDEKTFVAVMKFYNITDLIITLSNADINESMIDIHPKIKSISLHFQENPPSRIENLIQITKDVVGNSLIIYNHE